MERASAVGLSERGTRRLMLQLAVLDRLTSEPRSSSRDVLVGRLGRATARLVLAEAGCPHRPTELA